MSKQLQMFEKIIEIKEAQIREENFENDFYEDGSSSNIFRDFSKETGNIQYDFDDPPIFDEEECEENKFDVDSPPIFDEEPEYYQCEGSLMFNKEKTGCIK